MPRGYPANGLVTRRAAKNLARGTRQGRYIKGWFALDPDTFNQIRCRAEIEDMSFSEMLRLLVEWGLECH
jgi:hypothetical protein